MSVHKFLIQFIGRLVIFSGLLLAACGPFDEPTPSVPVSPTSEESGKKTIIVGGIFDLSETEGREYAAGVMAYTALFNSKGGAGGYKLDLRSADFAGKAPVAIEQYQRLVKEGAVAFVGWDTADTLALSRQIKNDRVVLMSASYAEDLVQDVKQQPYTFMLAPSYNDQLKIALLYAKQNRPDPTRTDQTGVGYLYSDDNFGRFPYQTGRDYSSAHKISWYHEGVLQPKIEPANLTFEANRLKSAHPEYTFVQAKPELTAAMLKVMREAEVPTIFLGLNYSGAANLPQLGGKAADGFMTTAVMAYPDETEPGLAEIRTWLKEQANSRATSPTPTPLSSSSATQLTPRFVQGWVTMKVLAEGIRLAAITNPGPINGDKVKAGLESITHFETGGITPALSFGPNKHKGTDIARIYKIENGQWKPISPYLSLASLEYQDSLPPTPTPLPVLSPTSSPPPRAATPRR